MKYTETGFFHFLTIFCFLNIFVILVDLLYTTRYLINITLKKKKLKHLNVLDLPDFTSNSICQILVYFLKD